MTGDVSLGDNIKAKFGAGNDLQIYSDGTSSYIKETSGAGSLFVDADFLTFRSVDGTETKAKFQDNGYVKLYHNNAQKLATTSTGVDVTGSVTCDGFTSTGIDDNATSTAITIDASENVGIGVVPKAWQSDVTALQIGSAGSIGGRKVAEDMYITSNSYYDSAWTPRRITANEAATHEMLNGKHMFKVAASGTADTAISWTTAMTIADNGAIYATNTGVLPSATKGGFGLRIDTAGGGSTQLYQSSGTYTAAFQQLKFFNGNGQVGSIQTNGSATSYNTSSDYRLKENVVPMTDSIDRLKDLKPSRFNFKADADKTVDGFLAHEAAVVVPECATGTKDAMRDEEYEVTPAVMDGETVVTEAVMGTRSVPDYQGIDQSKLVPLLVASLQEAVAKIEALEARVTALEV
jgi:hypothetical protein